MSTLIKLTLVTAILLFGLILYAAFVPSPTIAAECINYDETFAGLVARDMKPFTVTADRLPKVVADVEAIMDEEYGEVSRGFIIFGEAITVVGFEVGGCLLDPIYLKNPKAGIAS